jgi:hypothetical protein
VVRRCDEEKDREIQSLIAKKLGPRLVSDHGKKKFYSKAEIDKSIGSLHIPVDFNCWGYSLYMEHGAFDELHRLSGEACDYIAMKADMLNLLPFQHDASWFDFDLDLSALDIFDLFSFDITDIFN